MTSGPEPIRVAIVEDRREEREGLAYLLNRSPGFVCLAACASAEEALAALPKLRPNVVLMDIRLPGLSGIECVGRLKAEIPETELMMLTVFADHERIFQALAAGASGYLLKKTPPAEILEAVRQLHSGGAPMSGPIARQVIAVFQSRARKTSVADMLSPTEQSVLVWLAEGLLYKEIAEKLRIQVSTVRTHIWHIYRKLHVRNRSEAVKKAFPR